MLDTPLPRLHATSPEPLPFAPSLHVRAFVLERDHGNLLVYAAPGARTDAAGIEALGGVTRQYLNHWHEAGFGNHGVDAPLLIHADDRAAAEDSLPVDDTFSDRSLLDDDFELIPTPGHTPGATAFLWNSGEQRLLFTGDTVYLRDGEWVAAVLEGTSDRSAYIESLELLRELEFDALVPWAASGEHSTTLTDPADARAPRRDPGAPAARRGPLGSGRAMTSGTIERPLTVAGAGSRPSSCRGIRAGAPLVLLHEGLGIGRPVARLPAALHAATGRRVIAFSRFGHGRSEPPPLPRTPGVLPRGGARGPARGARAARRPGAHARRPQRRRLDRAHPRRPPRRSRASRCSPRT